MVTRGRSHVPDARGKERARGVVGASSFEGVLGRRSAQARSAQPTKHHLCKNCERFTAAPYLHSFAASLKQCKNQAFQTSKGWIVTPTSADATELLANVAFCSGNCLYSFMFSNELISNRDVDTTLHFFKRGVPSASEVMSPRQRGAPAHSVPIAPSTLSGFPRRARHRADGALHV